MKALWRRAVEDEEEVKDGTPESLHRIFDELLCFIRDHPREKSLQMLTEKELHTQEAVEQASRLQVEVGHRDPSGHSPAHPQVAKLLRDLEHLGSIYFETWLWMEDGGVCKVLSVYEHKQYVWQQFL
ncbi:hypothetical protein M422DRAFT_49370 [Sphaerobolus stellatus SS14]|uniref:Uncharacterized protein n=1 Tax=Sphaerobolus stellatus (strain SS14) TaxID=990650 RepID=A0A0C9UYW9_SPHS4|nr:hypothetical protein M422DRAFT_49370 [Sphaerobolus stellatus SS14]